MAGLKDVAKHSDVSITTASRVINHPQMVNAETRQRVEKAIQELDYQPNRVARRLRSKVGKSQIIGLIIPDIENSFYSSIVRGVEDVAYDRNYAVILCDSGEDPEREAFYLKALRGESVDGIILPPVPGERQAEVDRLAQQSRLPVVCFDRHREEAFDAVVTNNRQGARSAVDHLISQGYRDIGAICGPKGLSTTSERLSGYQDALLMRQLPVREEYIRTGAPNPVAARQMTEELLKLPSPPSALFTGNNQMSLGALKAIRYRGMNVPDDIALVGFDDAAWAELLDPPLTTVQQPRYEMGRRAAEMLFQRIEDPERPSAVITLKSKLIVRASCGEAVDGTAGFEVEVE